MAKERPATKTKSDDAQEDPAQEDPAVVALIAALDHPLKKEIAAARRLILDVDPSIREAVKWNAPSFRTADYFATIHLRSTATLQLVFHRGAKAKVAKTMEISDPHGMMNWRAPDRCVVTVGAGQVFTQRREALEMIVREWIRQL